MSEVDGDKSEFERKIAKIETKILEEQRKIDEFEGRIEGVESKIEEVERKIEEVDSMMEVSELSPTEKEVLYDEKNQLHVKKNKLLDQVDQLHVEKNKLLDQVKQLLDMKIMVMQAEEPRAERERTENDGRSSVTSTTPLESIVSGDCSSSASCHSCLSPNKIAGFEPSVREKLLGPPSEKELAEAERIYALAEPARAAVSRGQWPITHEAFVRGLISPLLLGICDLFQEDNNIVTVAAEMVLSSLTKVDYLLSHPNGEVVVEVKTEIPSTIILQKRDTNGILARCRANCQAASVSDNDRVFGILASSEQFVLFYMNHSRGRFRMETVSCQQCIIALIRLFRNRAYFESTPKQAPTNQLSAYVDENTLTDGVQSETVRETQGSSTGSGQQTPSGQTQGRMVLQLTKANLYYWGQPAESPKARVARLVSGL